MTYVQEHLQGWMTTAQVGAVQNYVEGWAEAAAKTLSLADAEAWRAAKDGIRYEWAVGKDGIRYERADAKLRRLADDLARYLGVAPKAVELGIDEQYGAYWLWVAIRMRGDGFIASAPIA